MESKLQMRQAVDWKFALTSNGEMEYKITQTNQPAIKGKRIFTTTQS